VANEDYVGVRLPKELISEVDRLVNRKALGFRSRAEFIADAIRRRLEEILAIEKAGGRPK
jgi:metal-responsive CopG/Arc/MetJ family transcriptional regulator